MSEPDIVVVDEPTVRVVLAAGAQGPPGTAGSAAGDVTGAYTALTVAAIHGAPFSNTPAAGLVPFGTGPTPGITWRAITEADVASLSSDLAARPTLAAADGRYDPLGAAAAALAAVAAIPVDAAAGVASLRTLGAGAQQAAAGNDSRLSDARTPTDNSVSTVKIVNAAVTTAKIAAGSITDALIQGGGLAESSVANLTADLSARVLTDRSLAADGAVRANAVTIFTGLPATAGVPRFSEQAWSEPYPAAGGAGTQYDNYFVRGWNVDRYDNHAAPGDGGLSTASAWIEALEFGFFNQARQASTHEWYIHYQPPDRSFYMRPYYVNVLDGGDYNAWILMDMGTDNGKWGVTAQRGDANMVAWQVCQVTTSTWAQHVPVTVDSLGITTASQTARVLYTVSGFYNHTTDLARWNLMPPASPTGVSAVLGAGGTLAVGVQQFYVIRADFQPGNVGAGGKASSAASAEVTVTPTNGNQTAALSWSAVTGATGYRIYRTTASGNYVGANSLLTTITSGATTTFNDDGSVALTAPSNPTNPENGASQVTVVGIDQIGRLRVGSQNAAQLTVGSSSSAIPATRFFGATGIATNISEWYDGGGNNLLTRVDKAGRLVTNVATQPVLADLVNGEIALSTDGAGHLQVTDRTAGVLTTIKLGRNVASGIAGTDADGYLSTAVARARVIAEVHADATANASGHTVLASAALPTGAYAAGDVIEIQVHGEILQNTTSSQNTGFDMTLGAATITLLATSAGLATGTAGQTRKFNATVRIVLSGTAGQIWSSRIEYTNAASSFPSGVNNTFLNGGTSAVDLTAAQNLTFGTTLASTSASYTVTLHSLYATLIKK